MLKKAGLCQNWLEFWHPPVSLRPFISRPITSEHIRERHRKKRRKTDFIHAVEKRPVRRTVAETLAKVQQVTATELHTAEGGNEFLDVLQHLSGRDWGGGK